MKINTEKIMEKASNASVGLAVAAAFFNVALILVKLVQTVTEESEKYEKE